MTNKAVSAETPVTVLPGISSVRQKRFESLGIRTLGDLVRHFPRAYQNKKNIRLLSDSPDGTPAAYILTVGTDPKSAKIRAGFTITKFKAFDSSGSCEVVFYNRPFADKSYPRGSVHRFYGKLTREKNSLRLNSPESEPCFDIEKLPPITPVYPLTSGLTQKLMSSSVRRALDALCESPSQPADLIPDGVREKNSLCSLSFAYENIHFPRDEQALKTAKDRLAFEELFLLSVFLGYSKNKNKREAAAAMLPVDSDEFFKALPFELTESQKRVCADIFSDMSKNVPMSRLVSGDVGSGKTVCAAAAVFAALKNGFQAALMVPTGILANQHYQDLCPLFEELGFKTVLLTGALKPAEKKKLHAFIKSGEADFVIGTHALLSDKVVFPRLGLVVTDEQHRFGVNQRALLGEKSRGVHMLVMSATPIPRTLALIIHGDLDVSRIDEMPPGRQKVDTFVVNESYRERLNLFIKKQVDAGHRVYIVCPAIEESEPASADEQADLSLDSYFDTLNREEKPPLKSAVEYARRLADEVFPEFGVGYIHSKMKNAEKEAVMADFVSGKIQILVSTTVIEVGVNVPAATLMIVENAERFGLSQLHQLRGRVGRGVDKSYCVLVSDAPKNSPAAKRLDVMKKTSDGFLIAEEDLKQRGPGDFLSAGFTGIGVRQHGRLKLKLASFSDAGTMMAASFAASELLTHDPGLSLDENRALKEYTENAALIRAATVN